MSAHEQLRERIQKFDDFITHTADVIATFDESLFEPDILPVVRQLGRVCEEAFMPNISDNGRVSFPESAQQTEGFAIVPVLEQSEVLQATASLGMPTTKRITETAALYDMSPAQLYEVCRNEVAECGESGWTSPIGLDVNTGAHVRVHDGHNEVDGVKAYLVSRPVVVVGPFISNLRPALQGASGVHEFTHGVDWQNQTDIDHFTSFDALNHRVWLEMRGFHTDYAALMAADSNFAKAIATGNTDTLPDMEQRLIQIENARTAHTKSDNPFGTPAELVDILNNKLRVIPAQP